MCFIFIHKYSNYYIYNSNSDYIYFINDYVYYSICYNDSNNITCYYDYYYCYYCNNSYYNYYYYFYYNYYCYYYYCSFSFPSSLSAYWSTHLGVVCSHFGARAFRCRHRRSDGRGRRLCGLSPPSACHIVATHGAGVSAASRPCRHDGWQS